MPFPGSDFEEYELDKRVWSKSELETVQRAFCWSAKAETGPGFRDKEAGMLQTEFGLALGGYIW